MLLVGVGEAIIDEDYSSAFFDECFCGSAFFRQVRLGFRIGLITYEHVEFGIRHPAKGTHRLPVRSFLQGDAHAAESTWSEHGIERSMADDGAKAEGMQVRRQLPHGGKRALMRHVDQYIDPTVVWHKQGSVGKYVRE